MNEITETMFTNFLEGSILPESNERKEMNETSDMCSEKLEAGTLKDDDLSDLVYYSLKAGFYAGLHVLRNIMFES